MHLVIHSQYYPPEVGAPQARLSDLARRVVARGHSVTVLTGMPNYPRGEIYPGFGGLLKQEWQDGIRIIRCYIYPTQKPNFLPRLTNYFSFVASSAVLGSFTLKEPDYIFTESPPLFLGLAGVWLSRMKRARLIFNVSDLWPESAVQLGMISETSTAYRLSSWLEKFCYQNAWMVTGQTRGIMADIAKRFPKLKTFHFSNGVDTQLFHPDAAVDGARSSLTNNEQNCVVVYAGLHGLAQGLHQVLAAADMLRGESDIRFVLVGTGPEKQALQAQARTRQLSNVRFIDPLPQARIAALLAAADIILVPLKIDIPVAAPSKLYEAMASGKPTVLAASGEAANIVRRHNAGVVVPPGDASGLAEAVRTLRDNPQLRRQLGANGRQAVEQNFDRQDITASFVDLLESQLLTAPIWSQA